MEATPVHTLHGNTEVGVWRHGQMIMNPAFFAPSQEKFEKQAQAREILQQVYGVPVESQASAADHLICENETLAPFLFFEAARTGHVEIKKAFMKSGKLGFSGGWDKSVNDYRRSRIKEVLEATGDDKSCAMEGWLQEFPDEGEELLFQAAATGHKDDIQLLLNRDVVPHSNIYPQLVPLHAACFNGNLDCAILFIARGVDVNIKDEWGGTALMRACVGGRTEVVRWLLQNGAQGDIREIREGNYNALEYGAGRDVEIVRLLIDSCRFSPTALMSAASFGNQESFDVLMEAGGFTINPGDVSIVEWENDLSERQKEAIVGSLDRCGSGEETKILQVLLSYIPRSKYGDEEISAAMESCIRRAVIDNRAKLVEMLLPILSNDVWRETERKTYEINQLFTLAADKNATDTVQLLVDEYGADSNHLHRPDMTTALYMAAHEGYADMIHMLAKKYRSDIHMGSGKFANGPTALWKSINQQQEKGARALIDCGGPVEYIDHKIRDGQTTRVFVAAAETYRAPVRLLAEMDPEWDSEECRESFICLEYPDGWPGGVHLRRSDEELKDERGIRPQEHDGFVIV